MLDNRTSVAASNPPNVTLCLLRTYLILSPLLWFLLSLLVMYTSLPPLVFVCVLGVHGLLVALCCVEDFTTGFRAGWDLGRRETALPKVLPWDEGDNGGDDDSDDDNDDGATATATGDLIDGLPLAEEVPAEEVDRPAVGSGGASTVSGLRSV